MSGFVDFVREQMMYLRYTLTGFVLMIGFYYVVLRPNDIIDGKPGSKEEKENSENRDNWGCIIVVLCAIVAILLWAGGC